jgi:ribonuclease HII
MPHRRSRLREAHPDRDADLFSNALECDPLFFERSARNAGYLSVAGLDEAGRGPLAGPVVAAAVVLPNGLLIPGLTDSKQVPEQERVRLYEVIRAEAVCYGVGIADERTIDLINILQATILAMERALQSLKPQPDFLLLDAISLPRVPLPQKPIIKGDCRSHSIAAASILAKVTRDRLMVELHEKYPCYNFQKHKGYGTKEHLLLLQEHGPCDAHRKTFNPISRMLNGETR